MRPLFLLALTLLLAPTAAQPPPGPATAPAGGPEVDRLLLALQEIDFRRYVNPLKLTPGQIEQIVAMHRTARNDIARIEAMEAQDLLALRKEIEEQLARSRQGAAVPAGFDRKVQEMEKRAAERRLKLLDGMAENMAQAMRKVLTAEQVERIRAGAPDPPAREGQDSEKEREATRDAEFRRVVGLILLHPRAPELLQPAEPDGGAPSS